MRILLEREDGSTELLRAEILPEDARVILMQPNTLLKPEDMEKISNKLTRDIGLKTVLIPAYIKDVVVLDLPQP